MAVPADVIEVLECNGANPMRPGKTPVNFSTDDPSILLPVHTGETAADEAVNRRVWVRDKAVVDDASATPQIARVGADVESGPVIDLGPRRSLEREVGRIGWGDAGKHCNRCKGTHAKPYKPSCRQNPAAVLRIVAPGDPNDCHEIATAETNRHQCGWRFIRLNGYQRGARPACTRCSPWHRCVNCGQQGRD